MAVAIIVPAGRPGGPYQVVGSRAAGGGNPFTLIANTSAASSGPTTGIDTTGANLIVVSISGYQSNVTPGLNLADNKSNTYTKLTLQESIAEASTGLFYCISPTVGSGHTFTYSTGGTIVFGAMEVQAWADGSGTPVFDKEGGAQTNSSVTTLATGSVTPAVNNSLIIAGVGSGTSTGRTYSIDTGFTITDQVSPAANIEGGAMAYLKQTTAAAVNPTWTQSVASDLAVTIAVFKP